MRDYAELVKALRRCRVHGCSGCYLRENQSCKVQLRQDAADAIEELLAKCVNFGDGECDSTQLCTCYGIVRAQINLLKSSVPKWTCVEERLPEQFVCVFATDGEDVGIAAFQGFIDDYPVWSNAWNLEYIEDQYDEDFLPVTHWMPLPTPPKEVE